MPISIFETIRIHFHAGRTIRLSDGATHTPDLDELNGEFAMLGQSWRYRQVEDVVYFALVVEGVGDGK